MDFTSVSHSPFDGLIHRKGFEGSAGDALEGASIVVEIEVESLNVFRAVSGQAVGCQEGRNLIVRESKDNLEVQRSAFATDDLEAEVTDLFPAGVSLFQFFVEEVFLEITAYGEFVKCSEFSFDKEKCIKSIL